MTLRERNGRDEGEASRTVLCYGDSNTWGADPETGGRLPHSERWTGVLAAALGEGFRVVEEGLPGRTTVFDDPVIERRNGRDFLLTCLESHAPVDLVAIMLGTNDLKARFGLSASDIAEGAEALARLALASGCGPEGGAPRVLLMSPPPIEPRPPYSEMFAGGEEKSRRFAAHYAFQAESCGCGFFDASTLVRSSETDGFHLDRGAHRALGEALASAMVEEMTYAEETLRPILRRPPRGPSLFGHQTGA